MKSVKINNYKPIVGAQNAAFEEPLKRYDREPQPDVHVFGSSKSVYIFAV